MSLILAAIESPAPIEAAITRWREVLEPGDELIVVSASRIDVCGQVENSLRNPLTKWIQGTFGQLVPDLWRDGIEFTTRPLIAFTTVQMVPSPGWRQALTAGLETGDAAALGGPIEPSRYLPVIDRAVYLQRYLNYHRPLGAPNDVAPPGENAIYRRDCLKGLESLWIRGFWEIEIQRALRDRGERFSMVETEAGVVVFQGGTVLLSFLRQRWRHGFRYGDGRTRMMGNAKFVAHMAAVPVIPLILLGRMIRRFVSARCH